MTKEQIQNLARPLLVKVLTRACIWLLTAYLGYTAAEAGTTGAEVAAGLGAALTAILGILIDRWHDKKDKAEVPEGST